MLLHAPELTSFLFAPSLPSQGSRRRRGGTERTTAAPRAAGTARATEWPGSALPRAGRSRPGAKPQTAATCAAREPPGRFPVSFRTFLSCTFAPPPSPPPPSLLRVPSLLRPAAAGAATGSLLVAAEPPRSSRGNFWTRWWCPLGKGEERSPGRRGRAANQGTAAGGGAGPGPGGSGEARPPGKTQRGRLGPRADKTRGGAGGAARARPREGRALQPPSRG